MAGNKEMLGRQAFFLVLFFLSINRSGKLGASSSSFRGKLGGMWFGARRERRGFLFCLEGGNMVLYGMVCMVSGRLAGWG